MQPVIFLLVLILLVHVITGCQYSGKAANKQSDFIDSLKEQAIANSEYHISLPPDYVIKAEDGPDFSVYRFVPADTTVTALYTAGIYFGNYPNLFEQPNDSCITTELTSKILGETAQWKVYQCDGKHSIQTIIDSKSNESWNSKIHFFGHADSEEGIQKVIDISSTLKIKNY